MRGDVGRYCSAKRGARIRRSCHQRIWSAERRSPQRPNLYGIEGGLAFQHSDHLEVLETAVVGQVLCPSVQLTYYGLSEGTMAEDFRQWSSVRLVGPTDVRPHFVFRAAEHRQRTGYRE